jgi:AraC family transcriptional regulator
MSDTDPLRRLLDAVLDPASTSLEDMADGVFLSRFPFHRAVRSGAGEPPVAMRRRVSLEQAAWRLQRGTSVTDAAFAAGYESLEGFSRAFSRAYGCSPSNLPPSSERGHWLPAPNGIHFHSPTVLYVDAGQVREQSSGDVLALMVEHDLEDIAALLAAAVDLPEAEAQKARLPGSSPRGWDGPDESIAEVARHLVLSKEPWLATVAGESAPDLSGPSGLRALLERHHRVAPRWLAMVRDIDRRDAWQDAIIDALCDPPESFLLSQILAHELTFSAHRRQLLRWMLTDAGLRLEARHLDPDPILWHRRKIGERP